MHSYKSHSFSLSVKLNQDKRSPVPHFLWSLAKPCSPFSNLHLPQPGTTPSLCLGRHLQPELPIPLACRAAPLPAPLSSKKVAEDFLQRRFAVKLFQSPALRPLPEKVRENQTSSWHPAHSALSVHPSCNSESSAETDGEIQRVKAKN